MINNLSTDQSMNLLYLVILLGVFALWMFPAFKKKPAKSIQNIGIWAAIFLFIIAAYSFKEEFNYVGDKIKSQLLPSTAVVHTDGALEFNKSQDGHFYIDAKINGVKTKFLLDTGASDITITLQDAQRCGINLENLRFDKIYNTANGQVRGARAKIHSLEIGNLRLEKINISINQGDMTTSLLGMEFLEQMHGYEVKGNKLIVWP